MDMLISDGKGNVKKVDFDEYLKENDIKVAANPTPHRRFPGGESLKMHVDGKAAKFYQKKLGNPKKG